MTGDKLEKKAAAQAIAGFGLKNLKYDDALKKIAGASVLGERLGETIKRIEGGGLANILKQIEQQQSVANLQGLVGITSSIAKISEPFRRIQEEMERQLLAINSLLEPSRRINEQFAKILEPVRLLQSRWSVIGEQLSVAQAARQMAIQANPAFGTFDSFQKAVASADSIQKTLQASLSGSDVLKQRYERLLGVTAGIATTSLIEEFYAREIETMAKSKEVFERSQRLLAQATPGTSLQPLQDALLALPSELAERSMLIDLAAELNETVEEDSIDEAATASALVKFIRMLEKYVAALSSTELGVAQIGLVLSIITLVLMFVQTLDDSTDKLTEEVAKINETLHAHLDKMEEDQVRYQVTRNLHLRLEPDRRSKSIVLLKPGVVVTLVSTQDDWLMVIVQDPTTNSTLTGYVYAKFVKEIPR